MASHYLITNREVTLTPGQNYVRVNNNEYLRIDGKEEARDELRYGTVTFNSNKQGYKIKLIPDFSDDELSDHTTKDKNPIGKKLGSFMTFDNLYSKGWKAKDREDVLIFIHGYHSDLDNAVETLKKLHEAYVKNPKSPIKHLVLFSWPARRAILKYRDDARDAVKSGYALARCVSKLKEFFQDYFVKRGRKMCNQKLHIMCHSMGNRVLESMFWQLREIGVEINSIFGEIVLVGADIDYDTFERPKPFYRLIDICERIHIYFHRHDQALGISELTKNAFNRLGRWGPKNTMDLPDDVYQSDVSDIGDDIGFKNDVVNHWYYFSSPSVVQDITEVLGGGYSVFNEDF